MDWQRTFKIVFLLALALFLPHRGSAENIPGHLKAELLSEQASLQAGKAVTIGIRFTMEKGWHIYWVNPGDSGQPPSVTWKLPPGFKADPLQWPVPDRIPLPSLADYGYGGEILLMSVLHAPKGLKPGQTLRLSAQVNWLVCKEACVPGQARLTLRLPVKDQKPSINPRVESLFTSTRENLPISLPPDWKTQGLITPKAFQLSFQTARPFSNALFFPRHPNQVENAAPQEFHSSGKAIQLKLQRSDQMPENIDFLEGLLVVTEKPGRRTGYEVRVPLSLGR